MKQILEAKSHETTIVWPPILNPSIYDEQDMRDTAREVKLNSSVTFSHEPLKTDEQVFGDQQELIYNSSVRTEDVAWKTCRKQWTIETSGERGSGKFLLIMMMFNLRDTKEIYRIKHFIFCPDC